MKKSAHRDLREKLNKDHSCYVLITCNKPSDDGKMQVEMSYEGDAVLASYLLHGAQSMIDDERADEDRSFFLNLRVKN